MIAYSDESRIIPMKQLFSRYGISRQGFGKGKESIERQLDLLASIRKEVVSYRENKDRRAGSRSLFHNLEIKSRYGIGINKFERMLSSASLTLSPMRTRVVTTKSCAQSWNYENLIRGLTIWSINSVIVGDITYLVIGKRRYYLFVLTDVYSARIVGHCVHDRMRKTEAIVAMEMCLELRGVDELRGCVHHTDGGKQYFSLDYLRLLTEAGLQVSVARDCLENGYAEQRNGLFKHHLLPTLKLDHSGGVDQAVAKLIKRYNYERKQEGLGWRTPVEYEEMMMNCEQRELKTISSYSKFTKGNL